MEKTDYGPLESLIKCLQLPRSCPFYKTHKRLILAVDGSKIHIW